MKSSSPLILCILAFTVACQDCKEDPGPDPVLIGDLAYVDFEVAGVPHCMAIAGRQAADLERLRQDLSLICDAQLELF